MKHADSREEDSDRFDTKAEMRETLSNIAYCAECDRLFDIRSGCEADIRADEAERHTLREQSPVWNPSSTLPATSTPDEVPNRV